MADGEPPLELEPARAGQRNGRGRVLRKLRKWLDADDELVPQLKELWDGRLDAMRDRAFNMLDAELARRRPRRTIQGQFRSATFGLPARISAPSSEVLASPLVGAQLASVYNVTCAPIAAPDEDLPRRVGEAAGGSTFATVNAHYQSEYGMWKPMFTLVVANPPVDARERMGRQLIAPWYIEQVAELTWSVDPWREEVLPQSPTARPNVLPPVAPHDESIGRYGEEAAWPRPEVIAGNEPQSTPKRAVRDRWYENATPEQKAKLDDLSQRAQRAYENASPAVKSRWNRQP